jgi:hypothetical protein
VVENLGRNRGGVIVGLKKETADAEAGTAWAVEMVARVDAQHVAAGRS